MSHGQLKGGTQVQGKFTKQNKVQKQNSSKGWEVQKKNRK